MTVGNFLKRGVLSALMLALMATLATAQGRGKPNCPDPNDSRCDDGGDPPPPPNPGGTAQSWMHTDVAAAWADGFTGAGATITVVDDYSSGQVFEGWLDDAALTFAVQHHGDWTSQQAGMIAPGATIVQREWSNGPVKLARRSFNIINASYGVSTTAGNNVDNLLFSKRDNSLIDAAHNGTAVVSKSAGNDWGYAVDDYIPTYDSNGNFAGYIQNYLSLALEGGQSTIFVGALQTNGSASAPAEIAGYSTIAGGNTAIQGQFLVVGVEAGGTPTNELANYGAGCGTVAGHCLYGTSFAAPVIAGYAAIVAHKFDDAPGGSPTPAQVAQQLLSTTNTNTLMDLGAAGWGAEDRAVYGMGEASLGNALAPIGLN